MSDQHYDTDDIPRKITIPIEEYAAMRVALAPLAMIANVYDQNDLDDSARKWHEPPGRGRVYADYDPKEVELYSGRGGRRLLTLADAFAARDALGPKPDSILDFVAETLLAERTKTPCSNCGHPKEAHARGQGVDALIDQTARLKLVAAMPIPKIGDRLRVISVEPSGEVALEPIADDPKPAHPSAADRAPVKRWPFRESPGKFANRLGKSFEIALTLYGGTFEPAMLSAVRTVLIEKPPALADWAFDVLTASKGYLPLGPELFGAIWDVLNGHPGERFSVIDSIQYGKGARSRLLALMPTPDRFPARDVLESVAPHLFAEPERKIVTEHVNPPIPWRHFDWVAYRDGDEPDDDGNMTHGNGATEAEAIADLEANEETAP